MNVIERTLNLTDNFQRRNRLIGFLYAVIKKYGDDQAGYQAALLTYYGFLSLFPLLLVLTTVVNLIAGSQPGLHDAILRAVTDYFPGFGRQLAEIKGMDKQGLALLLGILFTLYGARGVADAFQNGVNHIWRIPQADRDPFPKSFFKSLVLVIVGGAGLMLASASATVAAAAGQGELFRLLAVGVNLFILFWLFTFLLNFSLPHHLPLKKTRSGAASAAAGLVLLQTVGGFLLSRELKSLSAAYVGFALALGLLFWIYLQAQVIYYAVEISSVRANRLYPRSLTGRNLTDGDKRAIDTLATKERLLPPAQEEVKTRLKLKED